MHQCKLGLPVACVVMVLLQLVTSESSLFGRLRRDNEVNEGGMKHDGMCPDPGNRYASLTCPDGCRIELADYDCGIYEKCCPTLCSDSSFACMETETNGDFASMGFR
ncbi:uncharacterized protein LOC117303883 [Asterias rubens]|uniref:uncharacterized protein LOC117303883 n=1 Tax=Asterias rubens TaxID=7604 RepID=UPI001455AB48|nr:uncharacterized protein LOC117303883 [Asterias rubens]